MTSTKPGAQQVLNKCFMYINKRLNEPEEMVWGLERQTGGGGGGEAARNVPCKKDLGEQSPDAKLIPVTLNYASKQLAHRWQGVCAQLKGRC